MPNVAGLSKRKEAFLRGLARKAVRGHRGSFLAEGLRVVDEALSGRLRVTDVVATPSTLADIESWRDAGRLTGIHLAVTDERTFRSLSDSVHPQGLLAVVEEPRTPLRELAGGGPVLVLDRLQDPGNAGTLLRSFQATGGRTVLALKGTVDLFNPKAVRSSAGSLFHLDVASRLEPAEALAWLGGRRIALLALDARGEPLFDGGWAPPWPFALAVGNEGAGLAAALLERASRTLALPLALGVESLNAAVAGSVALYELWRRRRGSEPGGGPGVSSNEDTPGRADPADSEGGHA